MSLVEKQYKKDKNGRDQWEFSEAKLILRKAMRAGKITDDMHWTLVWAMYAEHPAFSEERIYGSTGFSRRLRELRAELKAKDKRAANDAKDFAHDRKKNPTPQFDAKGQPHWGSGPARQLLEKDIDDGKLKDEAWPSSEKWPKAGYKPEKLWESRPEYKAYSKKCFRDHIQQALRTRKFKAQFKDETWDQEEYYSDSDENEEEYGSEVVDLDEVERKIKAAKKREREERKAARK